MSTSELWAQALGRLHPAFLHFPLALLAAAALVELIAWTRGRPPSRSAAAMLIIAAISAPAAALSGWMNARYEGVEGEVLEWHRWSGVISAVGIVIAAIAGAVLASRRAAREAAARAGTAVYRGSLVALAALVLYCGHLGGEMKWGSGYTTEYLARALRSTFGIEAPASPGRAASNGSAPTLASGGADAEPVAIRFDEHVLPLLAVHCSECHLGGRRKGRLSLSSVGEVVRANDDELWVVKPGSADESELLRRVLLPDDDPDAMPPKGDRLSEQEVALVRRWIEQGAN
ncbi:MAG: hypothetical protein FJ253_06435 [Phycisphaerae bacterium]|nr:hypothetical protein [Phycisphaerae bacterium]